MDDQQSPRNVCPSKIGKFLWSNWVGAVRALAGKTAGCGFLCRSERAILAIQGQPCWKKDQGPMIPLKTDPDSCRCLHPLRPRRNAMAVWPAIQRVETVQTRIHFWIPNRICTSNNKTEINENASGNILKYLCVTVQTDGRMKTIGIL